MQMKRALMVSTHGYFEGNPSFGRADTGGQIVFVIELSKAMSQFGYQVDILSRQFEDYTPVEQLSEHVRIVRMPCGGNEFIPKEYLVDFLPELIDRFSDYVKQNNLHYEFIDSHYWDAGFVGEELSSKLGIPHIFTPHSLGIWKESNTRQTLANDGIQINELEFEKKYNFQKRNATEKTIMHKARQVIATTPEQKDIIQQKYGVNKEKIAVIPPGFFPEKYHVIEKNELATLVAKYDLPDRFAVTVGRIASNKGFDLLIKSFKDVIRALPGVHLVFAIGSDEASDIEKRRKLAALADETGLSQNIKFFGHIKELELFYNAAEIIVMPSTYEPFGMVAIEAMACGTPAVVTKLGGLKDFLVDGEDCLLVDPLDGAALSETIIRLFNDTELQHKLAKKGQEKALQTFTWEKIAESTLSQINKR